MKFLSPSIFTAGVLLAAAGLSINLSASPLPDPLSGIDFTARGSAVASYNSNVLSSPGNTSAGNTKFDDYIFTFNPGLTLKYGGLADTTLTFDYTETFYRYYEHPSLNEDLSNVDFNIDRKQGQFDLTAGVSFTQNYNNTPSSNGNGAPLTSILRSDVIDANGHAHWDFSQIFNFDGGFDYTQTRYLYSQGKTSENNDTYTFPVSGYYVYSDQLSLGAGYTYSETDPKAAAASPNVPGINRYNNSFTFNTKLTKWNKLTGTANVGMTVNHIDAGIQNGQPTQAQDSTALSYGLDLQYQYSDPIVFTLNGTRNFSTGTTGQNIEATTAGLGVNYTYSQNISATVNLMTYTYSQYLQLNRHDDAKTSGITLNWKPYTYLTLSAAYSYFMNSSDAASATYNINIISLSGTISY